MSNGFLTDPGGELRILYLGIRNSREGLEDVAFTQANGGAGAATVQLQNNTTTAAVTKVGCLAGSVASVKGDGVLGAGNGPDDSIVGLFVNDLAGNAYESSSAASSEKGVYVHGMGMYEVNIYETEAYDGLSSIMSNYTAGKYLYCSQNGLLTVEEGLNGGAASAGDVIIGIITKGPSSADLWMRFNTRL